MQSKSHFIILTCALASIIFFAGCANIPSPTPSPAPTALPTSTPVPSATQTIAPTRTPTIPPSATRTPLTLFQESPCGRCAAPQIVMDAQGTLHLFWRGGGDSNIGYAQMKPGGTWIKQPLDMNYANESYYIFNTAYKLIRDPNGQACVMALGMNFKTNEQAMLVRCFDGTAWRDTYKTSPSSCAYAFAPDGTVHGLDSKKLSTNLGSILGDCKLTIDRNGGYHVLWWAQDTSSVAYQFSADRGNTWSAAEKLAAEYSVSDLCADAQANLYYWTKTTYRRWIPNLGWQAPVDLRRYVNFDQYGIDQIKRLAPAPNGQLRALIGKMTGALYYVEQIADDKWSEPVLITQVSVNADLVIDNQGMSHIAYDQWGDVYYTTIFPTSTSAPASPTQTIAITRTPTIAPSPTRTVPTIATIQTGWIAKLGGPGNTRANLTAKLALPLRLAWEWREENNSPQAVAIANGRVFLLTSRGEFCILDAKTGAKKMCQLIWQDPRGSTSGQIALSGDMAFVSALELYIKPGEKYGSARTRLVAFSVEGQQRWVLPPIEDQVDQAIALGNGIIVSTSRTGTSEFLTAFDIANGAQRWKIPGSFNHSAIDGTVLYTDNGNTIARRLNTSEMIWEQSTNSKHVLYSEGHVFAVGDNSIFALDAATGKMLWKTSFGVFPLISDHIGVVAAHGHLYVLPSPGQTHLGYSSGVMTLDAATGTELWSAISGQEVRANHIAATADALVVVGTEWDGKTFAARLWVLNPANGAILDRVDLSTDYLDTVTDTAVADEQVYVLGRTLRAYSSTR